MAEQAQAQPDSNAEYLELESKNGKPYRIRLSKTENNDSTTDKPHDQAVETSTTTTTAVAVTPWQSSISVNWAPDTEQDPTSQAVQNTVYVGSYWLVDYGLPIPWRYSLTVTCNDPGTYYFQDQTGDIYSLAAMRPWTHTVQYNSDSPTIVVVGQRGNG